MTESRIETIYCAECGGPVRRMEFVPDENDAEEGGYYRVLPMGVDQKNPGVVHEGGKQYHMDCRGPLKGASRRA